MQSECNQNAISMQSACNQRAHLISQHVMRQHEARHHLLMRIARWERDVQAYLWGGGRGAVVSTCMQADCPLEARRASVPVGKGVGRRSEHLHAGRLPVGSETCKRTCGERGTGAVVSTCMQADCPLEARRASVPVGKGVGRRSEHLHAGRLPVGSETCKRTCGERGTGAVVSTCMQADCPLEARRASVPPLEAS